MTDLLTPCPLTHQGWFGCCPIYLGIAEGELTLVVTRHWSGAPLMVLSEILFKLWFTLRTALDPQFDADWPLLITGELAQEEDADDDFIPWHPSAPARRALRALRRPPRDGGHCLPDRPQPRARLLSRLCRLPAGYLPDAERQPCEIWSRVMGYHRPVSAWNAGKQAEHRDRTNFTEPQ